MLFENRVHFWVAFAGASFLLFVKEKAHTNRCTADHNQHDPQHHMAGVAGMGRQASGRRVLRWEQEAALQGFPAECSRRQCREKLDALQVSNALR